jgi:hypothetical protein
LSAGVFSKERKTPSPQRFLALLQGFLLMINQSECLEAAGEERRNNNE